MDAHATRDIDAPALHATALSPPGDRELAILRRVLGSMQFDGVATLRDQLRMLQVSPTSDPTCRIYVLHPDAPRSQYSREGRSKLPQGFQVHTPQGRLLGEVNVWVEDGHLRALQYVMPGADPALALPRPEWIDVPPTPIPAAVRMFAAIQAMAGVRLVGQAPTRDLATVVAPASVTAADAVAATSTAPASPSTWRARLPLIAMLATTLCVLAAATAAFIGAHRGGEDLDAARAAGTQAGAIAGAADGETLGAFDGDTQGRIAGRATTFRPAFDTARARSLAVARRQQERADAAAAAFTAQYGFLCDGAVDANGNWICS